VISVSELCRRLRNALEQSSGRDWVAGELGPVRQVSSGHCYFSLKDEREEAIVDCVAYRFQALRFRRHLREGARVQVFGKATFWAPRGRTQLIVEAARPVGRGELLERLQRLRDDLAREGLFDSERKRPLPAAPKVIGVVTSRDGAAWHDIVRVASRRGSPHLVLSSAQVQGEAAPASLLAAIDRIERFPSVELLIVGRGGGSFEDLLPFNDERVVRRVGACRVPVISAVGHEIDTSLCDLVADVRAATPSEAAELAVADTRARAQRLRELTLTLRRAYRARMQEDRATLGNLRARLSDPRFVIAARQQDLDDRRLRLERQVRRLLHSRRTQLVESERRLRAQHPHLVLARAKQRVVAARSKIERRITPRLADARRRLDTLTAKLNELNPTAVLSRGYAIVMDEHGAVVRHHDDVAVGQRVDVRLHSGSLQATVETTQGGFEE
jgi:exodeoxyribonuclease VII large subunit